MRAPSRVAAHASSRGRRPRPPRRRADRRGCAPGGCARRWPPPSAAPSRRAERPGLEHLLLPRPVQLVYPRQERLVDERPLLRRTSHRRLLSAPARHDVAIGRPGPAARLVALRRLAPGRHRVVALALALA